MPPPSATFRICMPRQIPSIGRSRTERRPRQRELDPVAKLVAGLVRGVRGLAVGRRLEVAAAGQQQPVDEVEGQLRCLRVARDDREDHRQRAGSIERFDVVRPDAR